MTFDFTRACKKVIENTYGIEKEYDINYPAKIIAIVEAAIIIFFNLDILVL